MLKRARMAVIPLVLAAIPAIVLVAEAAPRIRM